jgi:hypothetical protein
LRGCQQTVALTGDAAVGQQRQVGGALQLHQRLLLGLGGGAAVLVDGSRLDASPPTAQRIIFIY